MFFSQPAAVELLAPPPVQTLHPSPCLCNTHTAEKFPLDMLDKDLIGASQYFLLKFSFDLNILREYVTVGLFGQKRQEAVISACLSTGICFTSHMTEREQETRQL